MMKSLDAFLSEARKLRDQIQRLGKEQGKLRLQYMLMLIELRGQDLLWRGRFKSWDALLRGEKLCARTTYHRFELALKLLKLEEIERFGVTASIAITMVPVAYRKVLIGKVRSWYGKHGMPKPGHDTVSRYVWRQRRLLVPQEFVSRGRLLEHIEKLKKKLRDNGIRPPTLRKS